MLLTVQIEKNGQQISSVSREKKKKQQYLSMIFDPVSLSVLQLLQRNRHRLDREILLLCTARWQLLQLELAEKLIQLIQEQDGDPINVQKSLSEDVFWNRERE